MRRVFLFMVVVLVLGMGARPVVAMVNPAVTTLIAEPGRSLQQVIAITNETGATQTYSLEVVGVVFGDLAEDLRFVELEPSRRAAITLSEQAFVLEPQARRDVHISLSSTNEVPSEAFTFAVIARTEVAESGGVGVATAQAALFFIETMTDAAPELQIAAFETIPSRDHALPIKFAGLIQNTGASLSQPEVGIVIRNPWGKEIEHLSLNEDGRRLPGQTSRIFSAEWSGHPWRVGPYTAEFYVYPDETDVVIVGTLRVVLFPWQMLCVFAVLALVFTGTVGALIRARRR